MCKWCDEDRELIAALRAERPLTDEEVERMVAVIEDRIDARIDAWERE